MKFEVTTSFQRDFKKLKPEHNATFKEVVREKFAPACDAWAGATAKRKHYVWPKNLRVERDNRRSGHHGDDLEFRLTGRPRDLQPSQAR